MAKSDYDIPPDASFYEAAYAALHKQLTVMMANLDGTRAGDDVDALHDMRVASRRLRAALSVFAGAFRPKPFAKREIEVARVTDALGAVRDADVQIEFMQATRDAAPEREKVGLEALIAHLQKQRDQDRVVLVKELDRLEKSNFVRDFQAMLEDSKEKAGVPHG